MDESFAVAHAEGAVGGWPQETSRSTSEPRGGSRSLHIPDARTSLGAGVGQRAEARPAPGPATPGGAGRTTGLDSGRQHDFSFRDSRNSTGPRAPWAYP